MFTFRRFERVSTDDLMSLASERGTTPLQVGAVLMLDASESLEPGLVVDAIADRVCAVPRLRQRLVEVPWGAVGRFGSMIVILLSAATSP